LRERAEDVAPLARHFLARQAGRLGRPLTVDTGALQMLAAYAWPGNVRELANLVERLAILAATDTITAADVTRVLPPDAVAPPPGDRGSDPGLDTSLAEALDRYERQLIASALSTARGNVADAARRLSTDRANLYRRMRRLGLEPPRTLSD
jgi:two-component system nitrogen regulation response regulator NtrX